MNVVLITCDVSLVPDIFSIVGVLPDEQAIDEVEPELWTISAEATDAAIAEVEALGGAVEVIMDHNEFEQHIADFYEAASADNIGVV